MSQSKRLFGHTRAGEAVWAYTITKGGLACTVLDYGATVQSLCVPNRDGGQTDVVLGFDSVEGYENGTGYLGATIGRFANRLGGARFALGGKTYTLCANDGENCLHGGKKGFDRCIWQGEFLGEDAVRMSRLSPDGEEHFPGNLELSVTFRLTQEGALQIDYDAVCDADTLVNLTNHSYFDLSGCGRAMEQLLRVNAGRYLELGAGTLPTGVCAEVFGTPFDFTAPKPVGRDIDADCEQLRLGGGYDHNFCLDRPGDAATLYSDASGICMEVSPDLPGVQLYTANFLGEQLGKGGRPMRDRGAVCLETQLWPDAMNHWGFPSPILRRGQRLHSSTAYLFRVITQT